ncbi:MAG: hypothetical protein ACXWH7_12165 [Thermoanaerobaculia bacterium]
MRPPTSSAEAILRFGAMDDAVARSIEREVTVHVERKSAKLAGEIDRAGGGR